MNFQAPNLIGMGIQCMWTENMFNASLNDNLNFLGHKKVFSVLMFIEKKY